jgi:hypothetical protein
MPVKKLIEYLKKKQEVYVTIDDLLMQAEALRDGLEKLGEYKHPLKVRRGSRKEVTHMDEQQAVSSRTIKAGKKTYFFDIKETTDGKPYLVITESWFKDDENTKPDRNNIIIFPEQAKDFALAVSVMLDKIITS